MCRCTPEKRTPWCPGCASVAPAPSVQLCPHGVELSVGCARCVDEARRPPGGPPSRALVWDELSYVMNEADPRRRFEELVKWRERWIAEAAITYTVDGFAAYESKGKLLEHATEACAHKLGALASAHAVVTSQRVPPAGVPPALCRPPMDTELHGRLTVVRAYPRKP